MNNLILNRALNPKPGWYRGDFHAHTHFSDGALTPAELAALAEKEGLDFLAVTDHNTVASFQHFGNPETVLIIPGAEITLDVGHFNTFGIDTPYAWMERLFKKPGAFRSADLTGTVGDLCQQIAASGLIISINHPLLKPWEWQVGDLDVSLIQCIEIWNDPSWSDNKEANPQAVQRWTAWLNAGFRITAIGGSDFHRPTPRPGEVKPNERLGLPRTYVYAENLSGAAILNGLRQMRAIVSMGPEVTFQADLNGQTFGIGDDVGEVFGEIVLFGSILFPGKKVKCRIIKNGDILWTHPNNGDSFQFEYKDPIDPTRSTWYRLEVIGPAEEFLAVTNPIFTGPKLEPGRRLYRDFEGSGVM